MSAQFNCVVCTEAELPTFEFGTNIGQFFVYPLNFRLFTFTWEHIKLFGMAHCAVKMRMRSS